MTIPTLMSKIQDKQTISQIRKSYAEISQVFKLIQNDYEAPGDNSAFYSRNTTGAMIAEEFSHYIKGSTYCPAGRGTNAKACNQIQDLALKYSSKMPAGSRDFLYNYPRVILMNGTVLGFTRVSDCSSYTNTYLVRDDNGNAVKDSDGNDVYTETTRSNCGIIVVDVNGMKKPNQYGYDAYKVGVHANGLGSTYWDGALGYITLQNVLKNNPHPFEYYKYNE